jgi:hypothetical protein
VATDAWTFCIPAYCGASRNKIEILPEKPSFPFAQISQIESLCMECEFCLNIMQ